MNPFRSKNVRSIVYKFKPVFRCVQARHFWVFCWVLIALMLEATGKDLGRAAFMNTLVGTPSFDNGIYPPVTYTTENHFGGTGMHLLDADCTQKVYTTAEQFVPVA